MSDKYKALTVVLDDDYLAEDIEALMQCIRMLRGVADVTMLTSSFDDALARIRVAGEVRARLFTAVRDAFKAEGY